MIRYARAPSARFRERREGAVQAAWAGVRRPWTPFDRETVLGYVGFGSDLRSAEVRARFEVVRGIANRHLPDGASPIEVWRIEGGVATRLG